MDGKIGIVGGVGPYAGLDLQQKILANTTARRDQEHLSVYSISAPVEIADRTAYLLGESAENPAGALANQLQLLDQMGVAVAGIPCNTAHASPIFEKIETFMQQAGVRLRCLHMINEVGNHLAANLPQLRKVGVLSTTGTYAAGFYPRILAEMGFEAILPHPNRQKNEIHPAIYDPHYGIKACGAASPQARAELLAAIGALAQAGASAVILGCTELPLAIPEKKFRGVHLVDPTAVLARALIREVAPHKLRPLDL
jgi:aspartate racemase